MASLAQLRTWLSEVEVEMQRVALEAASLSGDGRSMTNQRLDELERYAGSLRARIAVAARSSRIGVTYLVPRP